MSKLDFQDTSNMLAQLGIGGPASEPKFKATSPEQLKPETISPSDTDPKPETVTAQNSKPTAKTAPEPKQPKQKKTAKTASEEKPEQHNDEPEQPSKPPMYIRSTQTATNAGCIRFTCMITKELYAALRVKTKKDWNMNTSDHVCAALNAYLTKELKEIEPYEIVLKKPANRKKSKTGGK